MITKSEALGLVFAGGMGLLLDYLCVGICQVPNNAVLGALVSVWLSLLIWE